MKPIQHFDKTWEQRFLFFLGWKPDVVSRYLRRHFGIEARFDCDGWTTSLTSEDGVSVILVWTSRRNDVAVLAHEVTHAANMCLGARGVVADFNNDEPVAYLVGSLMKKALSGK